MKRMGLPLVLLLLSVGMASADCTLNATMGFASNCSEGVVPNGVTCSVTADAGYSCQNSSTECVADTLIPAPLCTANPCNSTPSAMLPYADYAGCANVTVGGSCEVQCVPGFSPIPGRLMSLTCLPSGDLNTSALPDAVCSVAHTRCVRSTMAPDLALYSHKRFRWTSGQKNTVLPKCGVTIPAELASSMDLLACSPSPEKQLYYDSSLMGWMAVANISLDLFDLQGTDCGSTPVLEFAEPGWFALDFPFPTNVEALLLNVSCVDCRIRVEGEVTASANLSSELLSVKVSATASVLVVHVLAPMNLSVMGSIGTVNTTLSSPALNVQTPNTTSSSGAFAFDGNRSTCWTSTPDDMWLEWSHAIPVRLSAVAIECCAQGGSPNTTLVLSGWNGFGWDGVANLSTSVWCPSSTAAPHIFTIASTKVPYATFRLSPLNGTAAFALSEIQVYPYVVDLPGYITSGPDELHEPNSTCTAWADMTGNGALDIVEGTSAGLHLHFMKDALTDVDIALPAPAVAVLAADFTDDALPDVVVLPLGESPLLIQQPGGWKETPIVNTDILKGAKTAVAGDADGDGLLDIVFTCNSGAVLLTNISGARNTTVLDGTALAATMLDVDGNGVLDIITDNGTHLLQWVAAGGSPVLEHPLSWMEAAVESVITFVATEEGAAVMLYRKTSNSSSTAMVNWKGSQVTTTVLDAPFEGMQQSLDLDGDGYRDTAFLKDGNAVVFGNGNLTGQMNLGVTALTFADADRDGIMDIHVAMEKEAVTLYRGYIPPPGWVRFRLTSAGKEVYHGMQLTVKDSQGQVVGRGIVGGFPDGRNHGMYDVLMTFPRGTKVPLTCDAITPANDTIRITDIMLNTSVVYPAQCAVFNSSQCPFFALDGNKTSAFCPGNKCTAELCCAKDPRCLVHVDTAQDCSGVSNTTCPGNGCLRTCCEKGFLQGTCEDIAAASCSYHSCVNQSNLCPKTCGLCPEGPLGTAPPPGMVAAVPAGVQGMLTQMGDPLSLVDGSLDGAWLGEGDGRGVFVAFGGKVGVAGYALIPAPDRPPPTRWVVQGGVEVTNGTWKWEPMDIRTGIDFGVARRLYFEVPNPIQREAVQIVFFDPPSVTALQEVEWYVADTSLPLSPRCTNTTACSDEMTNECKANNGFPCSTASASCPMDLNFPSDNCCACNRADTPCARTAGGWDHSEQRELPLEDVESWAGQGNYLLCCRSCRSDPMCRHWEYMEDTKKCYGYPTGASPTNRRGSVRGDTMYSTWASVSTGGEMCQDLMVGTKERSDGVYKINTPSGESDVYCDMNTDGGGWELILSVKRNTTGNTTIADSFPTQLNGSAFYNNLWYPDALEMRFFCNTTAHNRTIHFVTQSTNVSALVKTSANISLSHRAWTTFRPLGDHTASLPASTTAAGVNLTFRAFASADKAWSVGDAWECDDMNSDGETLHQVWIRRKPLPRPGIPVMESEQCDGQYEDLYGASGNLVYMPDGGYSEGVVKCWRLMCPPPLLTITWNSVRISNPTPGNCSATGSRLRLSWPPTEEDVLCGDISGPVVSRGGGSMLLQFESTEAAVGGFNLSYQCGPTVDTFSIDKCQSVTPLNAPEAVSEAFQEGCRAWTCEGSPLSVQWAHLPTFCDGLSGNVTVWCRVDGMWTKFPGLCDTKATPLNFTKWGVTGLAISGKASSPVPFSAALACISHPVAEVPQESAPEELGTPEEPATPEDTSGSPSPTPTPTPTPSPSPSPTNVTLAPTNETAAPNTTAPAPTNDTAAPNTTEPTPTPEPTEPPSPEPTTPVTKLQLLVVLKVTVTDLQSNKTLVQAIELQLASSLEEQTGSSANVTLTLFCMLPGDVVEITEEQRSDPTVCTSFVEPSGRMPGRLLLQEPTPVAEFDVVSSATSEKVVEVVHSPTFAETVKQKMEAQGVEALFVPPSTPSPTSNSTTAPPGTPVPSPAPTPEPPSKPRDIGGDDDSDSNVIYYIVAAVVAVLLLAAGGCFYWRWRARKRGEAAEKAAGAAGTAAAAGGQGYSPSKEMAAMESGGAEASGAAGGAGGEGGFSNVATIDNEPNEGGV